MEHKPTQLYRGPVGAVAEPVVRLLRGRGLSRYQAVWKVHRALWRFTRSNRAQIWGLDLEVDRLDSLALAKGWYDLEEKAFYTAEVRPGDFVVEAGANVGVFTLMLSELTGPTGAVRTYEPDPELRGILERNVARHRADNVTVRGAAVAAEPGEMTFFRAGKNQGDNRLFTHDGKDGATFPVPVVRLDDELADLPRVDLLKMDIQGAEVLALRGMTETLAAKPPRTIMMEFWPHGIVGMGGDPRRVIEELLTAGYDVRALGEDRAFDLDRALTELTVENLRWVNLVLRHRDGRDHD